MGSSQTLSFVLTQDTTIVLAVLIGTCIATDTMEISSSKSISFSIGADRATCNDTTMVFNSVSNLVNEVWTNLAADTIGFGNAIAVNITQDTTILLFADSLTCSSSDTMFVGFQGFNPDLGADSTTCTDILVNTDLIGKTNIWYRLAAGDTVVGGNSVTTVTVGTAVDETIILEASDAFCTGFDTIEVIFPNPLAAISDTATLNYLAAEYPQAKLAPLQDNFLKAKIDSFNSYMCSTVHVAHAHLWRAERWADSANAIDAMAKKVPQNMIDCFNLIENSWLQGPWVQGEHFSSSDLYLFVVGRWLSGDGVELKQFQKVYTHQKKMLGLKEVQDLLEGLYA